MGELSDVFGGATPLTRVETNEKLRGTSHLTMDMLSAYVDMSTAVVQLWLLTAVVQLLLLTVVVQLLLLTAFVDCCC